MLSQYIEISAIFEENRTISHNTENRPLCCYSKRLDTKGTEVFDWKGYPEPHHRFDWQLQSAEDLLEIVNRAYEEALRPLIETDLAELY